MRYAVAHSTLRNHGAIPKYVGKKAAGLIVYPIAVFWFVCILI
ncbi:hypothetical protein [Kovacikia minuta]|nr:hypothetical protein [Kovacikia minuta]